MGLLQQNAMDEFMEKRTDTCFLTVVVSPGAYSRCHPQAAVVLGFLLYLPEGGVPCAHMAEGRGQASKCC